LVLVDVRSRSVRFGVVVSGAKLVQRALGIILSIALHCLRSPVIYHRPARPPGGERAHELQKVLSQHPFSREKLPRVVMAARACGGALAEAKDKAES
jgi:hypothetical protein